MNQSPWISSSIKCCVNLQESPVVLSNEDDVVEEDVVNVSPNHTYVYNTPSPHTLTTDPDTNDTIRSSFSYDKVRWLVLEYPVISHNFP